MRQICPNCKTSYTASRDTLVRYGFPLPAEIESSADAEIVLYKGNGCEKCKGTGYKGRTGVHELLVMTDELRDLILHKAPALGIKLVLNMAHVLSERLDDAVLLGRR